jgi:hypothetical protein
MGYTVTPLRRRLVMAALLGLATAGGVIRHYAENPSTLRDVGTLLLVLWLPAVGNLIAFLVRQIPRAAPPPTDFAAGSAFAPHLRVRLEPVALPPGQREAMDLRGSRCTVLVGRAAFTARLAQPLADALDAPQELPMELLMPAVAERHLVPGTDFHLLVGATAVAKGQVI